ncbi:MAG: site-specific DNA-methyltransferase [Candidatus Aenigmatarchaeota archaeon]
MTNFLNKIICGDSEEVLKNFPSEIVDLVFTSPPYNFGKRYLSYNDRKSEDEYFSKLFRIFEECIRVLKNGGRFIINIQPFSSEHIPTHHIISCFLRSKGLIWYTEILWEKHNYNCRTTQWGSFQSPSQPHFRITWEFIEVYAKGSLRHEGLKENITLTKSEFAKWTYAKWEIPAERNMDKFNHPSVMPEELAERVIKMFTYKGDLVLDPFNGVGTTTYVAKNLGRNYIGIEIDPHYCEIAEKRLKKLDLRLFE